jgi:hypothetical protein
VDPGRQPGRDDHGLEQEQDQGAPQPRTTRPRRVTGPACPGQSTTQSAGSGGPWPHHPGDGRDLDPRIGVAKGCLFAIDDIHDTIARLRAHGAELLGEVAQYENIFLLCYLRGPAGIIVALAEQIG